MSQEEKMKAAVNRAYQRGDISAEVLGQLPSMEEFIAGIVIVTGVLAGLGVAAGAVASTGVGAILEGIAAGIVLALSAFGIITSGAQIIAGIKTLLKFYNDTKKAQSYPELDIAGTAFARGIAEVGVGTIFMIMSVLGARKGFKMGRKAVTKWNGAGAPPPEVPPPGTPPPPEKPPEAPPDEPKSKVPRGTIDESAKPFSPKEKAIANTLADEGKDVTSVKERSIEGVRTGDALVDGKLTEFKSPDPGATNNTIKNEVSDSMSRGGQARDIVVDARGTGLDESEAQRALSRIGGIQKGRLDSVRIIGDGYDTTRSY